MFSDCIFNNGGYLYGLITLSLLLPALYLVGWTVYTRFIHPLSDIPGPFWASFSRLWLGYQLSTGKFEFLQRDLHKRLGPIVRIAPDEVSISDPKAVKIIYGIKSGFCKTDFYPPFASNISTHGDHFSQLDEARHAERRKIVNHVYSMTTILESERYIDTCSATLMAKMKKFAQNGQAIDLGEWIQWYTFDVVGELFFGQAFGFMRDEHDYGHYIRSLDTLLPGIAVSCVLPPYLRTFQSILGLLLPSIRDSFRGFDDIRRAGKFWVHDRMEKMAIGKVERSDLLSKFFQIQDKKEEFDVPDIESEAVTAIFAGSDTTAIAIRSILYHILRTPSIYDKLVSEIDQADEKGLLSRPYIRYKEAMQLPYLVACCKEGMRMHPSVALSLPRYVPPGGRVIAGRYFPEGAKVGVNAAVIHFDTAIFGSDAALYNPDRWMSKNNEAVAEMDRSMFQFGAGSRTCIGRNVSLAEIYKLIPQLLRLYRFHLVKPENEWETHNFWFNKQTGIKTYVAARPKIEGI